jgi:hypothetical protein
MSTIFVAAYSSALTARHAIPHGLRTVCANNRHANTAGSAHVCLYADAHPDSYGDAFVNTDASADIHTYGDAYVFAHL